MKPLRIILATLLTLSAVSVSGCLATAELRETMTRSLSISPNGASSATVDIDFGLGDLTVSGGAANLLDAVITSNVPAWEPRVAYTVNSGKGRLSLDHPDTGSAPHGCVNTWVVKLSDELPLDLTVQTGIGGGKLYLGSLRLRQLTLDVGLGDTLVDLCGTPREPLRAAVHGGVGDLEVWLPRDTGVRVRIDESVGDVRVSDLLWDGAEYTNGLTPAMIDLDLEGSVGNIIVNLKPGLNSH